MSRRKCHVLGISVLGANSDEYADASRATQRNTNCYAHRSPVSAVLVHPYAYQDGHDDKSATEDADVHFHCQTDQQGDCYSVGDPKQHSYRHCDEHTYVHRHWDTNQLAD